MWRFGDITPWRVSKENWMSIGFRLLRHDSLQVEGWTYYLWCILWLLKIILKGVLASLEWDLSTPLPLFAICIDQVETGMVQFTPFGIYTDFLPPFGFWWRATLQSVVELTVVLWVERTPPPPSLLVSTYSCSGHHAVWNFHSFHICVFSKLVVCSCVLTFLLFCILIGWSYHSLSFSACLTLQGRGETAIQ